MCFHHPLLYVLIVSNSKLVKLTFQQLYYMNSFEIKIMIYKHIFPVCLTKWHWFSLINWIILFYLLNFEHLSQWETIIQNTYCYSRNLLSCKVYLNKIMDNPLHIQCPLKSIIIFCVGIRSTPISRVFASKGSILTLSMIAMHVFIFNILQCI